MLAAVSGPSKKGTTLDMESRESRESRESAALPGVRELAKRSEFAGFLRGDPDAVATAGPRQSAIPVRLRPVRLRERGFLVCS